MTRRVCVGTVPIGEVVILHTYRGERIGVVNGNDDFQNVCVVLAGNYNTKGREYALWLAPTDLVEVD